MTTPFWHTGTYVSDGGLETDLIFNRGVDLPLFAAFPLLDDETGRGHLRAYFSEYAEVARQAGTGLTMETPTWRAGREWGAELGYDEAALDRVNREAVGLLAELRAELADLSDVRIIGVVGPRGDGYVPDRTMTADEAAAFHLPQVASLAEGGADVVGAYTLTTVAEGVGVSRAARRVGVPVLVGFTVETDGRLPDGTPLGEAVRALDAQEAPDGVILNCAHPTHLARGLDGGDWQERVVQVNPNASTLSHAELDEAETLDAGDLDLLRFSFAEVRSALPGLAIVGGCCGTDARHVTALAGVRT